MSRIRSTKEPPKNDVSVLLWFQGEWWIGSKLNGVWILDGSGRVLNRDDAKWWATLPPAPKDGS